MKTCHSPIVKICLLQECSHTLQLAVNILPYIPEQQTFDDDDDDLVANRVRVMGVAYPSARSVSPSQRESTILSFSLLFGGGGG